MMRTHELPNCDAMKGKAINNNTNRLRVAKVSFKRVEEFFICVDG
jgi:hypothetical protein